VLIFLASLLLICCVCYVFVVLFVVLAAESSGSGNDIDVRTEPRPIDWHAAAAWPNPVPALPPLLPDPAPPAPDSPRSPGPVSESTTEQHLTAPRRLSLLISPRPKHEHRDAKGSPRPPKPVDCNGMQIVVPMDNWLCGALATLFVFVLFQSFFLAKFAQLQLNNY